MLAGESAAILYADHRESRDHDHVVADLADRFEMVLEAIEGDEGWATNRVTPGKVILGNLDGIEAGVRQMIRKTPLEVTAIAVPSGGEVTVPTIEETPGAAALRGQSAAAKQRRKEVRRMRISATEQAAPLLNIHKSA